MKRILAGQTLLILCCVFYLIWWYRGYRPGTSVNRMGGVNGILLFITAALGITGIILSLGRMEIKTAYALEPVVITAGGVAAYFVLMAVTRYGFQRIVTTELILIVGWSVLELTVVNRLFAAEVLSGRGFAVMCVVLGTAFVVSMVLYVAYYRMEAMQAFYAAMVPLVTEGASMAVLAGMLLFRLTGKN